MEDDPKAAVAARYDALFFDLDGVLYRGDQAIAGAAEALAAIGEFGIPRLFLSNNSSRTPDEVAAKLTGLGFEARPRDVVTSALATASFLEREGQADATAYVIGEQGIREALGSVGIQILDGDPARTDLVVIGLDHSVDYGKLRTASLLVERGARLVATNADPSLPAPDGLWPGAGALVAAVAATTGVTPVVIGKPARPMFEAAAQATGARRPLVVGDRLDTDIRGADAMGWDSLLVLTGATRPPDLLTADETPTYVAAGLSALTTAVPPARFRPAWLEEADAIEGLLRSAGLSADGVRSRIPSTMVSASDDLNAGPDATACLEVVGDRSTTEAEAEAEAILRSVAVRKEHRRTGLGTLAVASAVREARRLGLGALTLFTVSASVFFEHLGFRRAARDELPEAVRTSRHATEECAQSAVPMRLKLRSRTAQN